MVFNCGKNTNRIVDSECLSRAHYTLSRKNVLFCDESSLLTSFFSTQIGIAAPSMDDPFKDAAKIRAKVSSAWHTHQRPHTYLSIKKQKHEACQVENTIPNAKLIVWQRHEIFHAIAQWHSDRIRIRIRKFSTILRWLVR